MKMIPNQFPKIIDYCSTRLGVSLPELDELMGWPYSRSTFIAEGWPMSKQELIDLAAKIGVSARMLLLCELGGLQNAMGQRG